MPEIAPRILLKLSGEALMGADEFGINPKVIATLAKEVAGVVEAGAQVAIVVGGGNIFRGAGLAGGGMNRVTGDQMGMLATVMNGLALQDALEHIGMVVRVMSALRINQVCEEYIVRRAIRHLEKQRVVVFVAGTGNPFFTTDTAASLRAVEIGASMLLKATKVDGIYDADPVTHPNARRYQRLSYQQVLDQRLAVMDTTAIVMCRDNHMPLRVYDMQQPRALMQIVQGGEVGTLVSNEQTQSDQA